MSYLLERLAYTPQGVFGRLQIPNGPDIYTCGLPYKGNAPGESCIPDGEYRCEPHHSERYPHTWALVGPGVSHYSSPDVERYAILFHAGNTRDDLNGCIAPGLALGALGGRWAVMHSRDAMSKMRHHLPDHFDLSIIPATGTEYP